MKIANVKKVKVDQIRANPDFQVRVELNSEAIETYTQEIAEEVIAEGKKFPPIKVVALGDGRYEIIDGHHRLEAFKKNDRTEVEVEIVEAVGVDAFLMAFDGNRDRGLLLTRKDKHKVVEQVLKYPDWKTKSAREIGKRLGFSDTFVGDVKREIEGAVKPQADSDKNKDKKPKKSKNASPPTTQPEGGKAETPSPTASQRAVERLPSSQAESSPADKVLALCQELISLLGQLSRGVPIITDSRVVIVLKDLQATSQELLDRHFNAVDEIKKPNGGTIENTAKVAS